MMHLIKIFCSFLVVYSAGAALVSYSQSASTQEFSVPTNVNKLTVTVCGATGYSKPANSKVDGGVGACLKGTMTVTPESIVYLNVGQLGGRGSTVGSDGTTRFGGGSSEIRYGSNDVAGRVFVAGGGGGGGSAPSGKGTGTGPGADGGNAGYANFVAVNGGKVADGAAGKAWSNIYCPTAPSNQACTTTESVTYADNQGLPGTAAGGGLSAGGKGASAGRRLRSQRRLAASSAGGSAASGGAGGAAATGQNSGAIPGGAGGGGAGYTGGGGGGSYSGGGGGSSFVKDGVTDFSSYANANGSPSVTIEYVTLQATITESGPFTIPSSVNNVLIEVAGARGGHGNKGLGGGAPGNGGIAKVYTPVTPGDVYYAFIGKVGEDSSGKSSPASGGSGGGGSGYNAGGGGGYSAISPGNSFNFVNAIIVAGGGGGASQISYGGAGGGGDGGGTKPGIGATISAGGAHGAVVFPGKMNGNCPLSFCPSPTAGSAGNGGNGGFQAQAGGGGGKFGGGAGGTWGGGGGGSSFCSNGLSCELVGGVNGGNGFIKLYY